MNEYVHELKLQPHNLMYVQELSVSEFWITVHVFNRYLNMYIFKTCETVVIIVAEIQTFILQYSLKKLICINYLINQLTSWSVYINKLIVFT